MTNEIKPEEEDGSIQAVRAADDEMAEEKITESRGRMTGGQEFEPFAPDAALPFLSGEEMGPFVDVAYSPKHVCGSQNFELDVGTLAIIHTNPAAGVIPSDISEVDLALVEDTLRKAVCATDDWVNTNYPTRRDPEAQEVNAETSDIDLLFDSISFLPHPNSSHSSNIIWTWTHLAMMWNESFSHHST